MDTLAAEAREDARAAETLTREADLRAQRAERRGRDRLAHPPAGRLAGPAVQTLRRWRDP
ncbi:hypothetical protein GCM10009550_65860 [Actinocorallia libanotica]|uniref:Uncharacterized protein n=1 Tax=Actinocorallia libanotica TaxID=46162 RepID=A0ABP4CCK0_9ACTN